MKIIRYYNAAILLIFPQLVVAGEDPVAAVSGAMFSLAIQIALLFLLLRGPMRPNGLAIACAIYVGLLVAWWYASLGFRDVGVLTQIGLDALCAVCSFFLSRGVGRWFSIRTKNN